MVAFTSKWIFRRDPMNKGDFKLPVLRLYGHVTFLLTSRALSTSAAPCQNKWMKSHRSLYYGHRYPREIISHAVWVYYRFGLNLRDVEDLLAKRGVAVSYETIRRWCKKFGPVYARRLRRSRVDSAIRGSWTKCS